MGKVLLRFTEQHAQFSFMQPFGLRADSEESIMSVLVFLGISSKEKLGYYVLSNKKAWLLGHL